MKGEWSWNEMLELLRLKTQRQRDATHFRSSLTELFLNEPNGIRFVVRDGNIVKT